MMMPRRPADPDSSQAAYLRALKWLTSRELSEHEVRARLAERGFNREAVKSAVERLVADRTIDDRRAAAAVARTEARVRRRGRRRVSARLASMQIDRDLAKEVIDELFGGNQEAELIDASLERRIRGKLHLLKDSRQRRKVHAYLVRQGFSGSAAAAAIRRHSQQ
jgi:regulatory protein